MNLTNFAEEVHENAVNHGWWDAQFSSKEIAVVADALEQHPELRAKVIEKLEEERTFGDIVALCHSELSESLEEYRNNKPLMYYHCGSHDTRLMCPDKYDGCQWGKNKGCKQRKPEGIAVELADCIIRILDYCGKENIDIESVIKIKHEYNKTRPYKHGGKVI